MRRLLGLLLPAALLVAACGDDEPVAEPGTTTTTPATAAPTTEPDEDADAGDDDPDAGAPGDEETGGEAGADSPAAEPPPDAGLDEGMRDVLLVADLAGADGVEGRFEAELVDGVLCADLVVRGLGVPAAGAHVRPAPAGDAVAAFGAPTEASAGESRWEGACTELEDHVIDALAAGLDHHHVAVVTEGEPDGAAAGALGVATVFDRTLRQP